MNKFIHAKEYRLRILLTNQCNKSCSFCLNDFQQKQPPLYINASDAINCIKAYGAFMNDKSIVTFSGGEPGIYPVLKAVLVSAKIHCKIVKVVTNGTALDPSYIPYVDTWHIGTTFKDSKVVNFLEYTKKIKVQIVVTKGASIKYLCSLIEFYSERKIKIKLFTDFLEYNQKPLINKINSLKHIFGDIIETRFTGKQINRGKVCKGCLRRCITLKALWLSPKGESFTCPQGQSKALIGTWKSKVEQGYNGHLFSSIGEKV